MHGLAPKSSIPTLNFFGLLIRLGGFECRNFSKDKRIQEKIICGNKVHNFRAFGADGIYEHNLNADAEWRHIMTECRHLPGPSLFIEAYTQSLLCMLCML